jgi:pectin methylesterase-like acyl-CoA thioesterase
VLVVAESGGDFTSVQAALDSIPASPGPTLIYIAPGEYDGHVTMKPNVDLMGAGRNLSTLTMTDAGSPEVLEAAAQSTISDLSIVNSRPDTANTSVAAEHNGSSVFSNVRAVAESSGPTNPNTYGFDVTGDQTLVILKDVSVDGRGSSSGQTIGIRVSGIASIEVNDSQVEAVGFGDGRVRAIENLSGSLTIDHSTVRATAVLVNDQGTVGLATGSIASGASSIIVDSRISSGATAGNDRSLLVNGDGSQLRIRDSILFNQDGPVIQSTPLSAAPTIRIVMSQLDGGDNQIDAPAANLSCLFSYNENFVVLDGSCAEIAP